MASSGDRQSILLEGLLISALLMFLSFSSCNATSRSMGSMAVARSCQGQDCQPSYMKQNRDDQHMSSLDSVAAAEAKLSDPRMADRVDSEWGSMDSQPKGIMNPERSRNSESLREDRKMVRDMEWKRDSERMTDPSDQMSDSKGMRDFDSERSNMENSNGLRSSERMSAEKVANTHGIRNDDRQGLRPQSGDGMTDTTVMSGMHSKGSNADGFPERKYVRDSQSMSDTDSTRNWDGQKTTEGIMRDSHQMIDSERVRDESHQMIPSDRMGDSSKVIDSDRMIHSNRMRDSNQMIHTDRIIDSESDSGRMRNSNQMIDSEERMRASHQMISSNKMSNSDSSMRDSQEMIDSHGLRDSNQRMGTNILRDSDRMIDRNRARDSHQMMDSNRLRDSDRMIDSNIGRDSHQMMEPNNLRDSDRMTDSNTVRDQMMDSNDRLRDSHQMMNSDRMTVNSNTMRDSENHATNSQRRTADIEGANERESEIMEGDSMWTSEGRRNLENPRGANLNSQKESVAEMMRGEAEHMRNLDSRRGDLERSLGASDQMAFNAGHGGMRDGSERMNTNSQTMASIQSQYTARALEPTACHGAFCPSSSSGAGFNSEHEHRSKVVGGQMRNLNSRRGDLESGRRDSDEMRDTASDHQTMEQMSTDGADRSRAFGHKTMEFRQHSDSAMETNSCHAAADCSSSSDGQGVESKRWDGETSRAETSDRCTGLNGADCTATDLDHAQQLRGSHEILGHLSGRQGSCSFNGADCRVTPDDRETHNNNNNPGSTTSGRLSSCSDCQNSPSIEAMDDQSMTGLTDSERIHTTRNDREIISPKWMKMEKRTTKVIDTQRIGHSEKTVKPISQRVNTDSESSMVTDEENRNSQGLGMVHSTAGNGIGMDPSSCTDEAKCRTSTSGNGMQMMPGEVTRDAPQKQFESYRDPRGMEHVSDRISASAEIMRSEPNSKRNAEEANADRLQPTHGAGN